METGVAKINRFGVQIDSAHRVPAFSEPVKQATGAASRFEESLRWLVEITIGTAENESNLRSAVGTKNQVVVFRIVVDRLVDRFDRNLGAVVHNCLFQG